MSSTVPEPVTRPLRADAARNRTRVIEAARDAFAERGQLAQMEDVARRAGVGVGTLYRHFPTKEALGEAVLDLRLSEIEAYVREEGLAAADPWEGLVRVFRNAGECQARDRGLADAITEVLGEEPANCSHRDRLGPLVAELVRRGQKAGVVRADLREEDLPPLFCGLGAVARSGEDWERYLEFLLAGLRAR